MDFSLIQEYAQYGIFAVLFISLFVWVIKSGEKREKAMQDTLNRFAENVGDKLGKIETISADLAEVKTDISEVKADVEDIKEQLNK